MFVTRPQFELYVPTGIAELNSRYWLAIDLSVPTCWYLCVYSEPSKELSRTTLIAWESGLLDLVTASGGQRLLAVARLGLSAGDHTRWEMRWVESIWLAAGDERQDIGPLVFKLENDDLPRDDLLNALDHREDRKLVFRCARTE